MTHVTLIWLIKHGNGEPHKLSLICISVPFFRSKNVMFNITYHKRNNPRVSCINLMPGGKVRKLAGWDMHLGAGSCREMVPSTASTRAS